MPLETQSAAMFLAFAIGMFAGVIVTVFCDVWNWWLKKKGWKA
jgi:hypothetical protein